MAWKRALGVACVVFIAGCESGVGDSIAPVFTATVTDSAGEVWDLSGEAVFNDLVRGDGPVFVLQLIGRGAYDRASVFLGVRSRLPASGRYEISGVRSDSTLGGATKR